MTRLALPLALALVACKGTPEDTDTADTAPTLVQPPDPSEVSWEEGCGEGLAATCARIDVPVDHLDAAKGWVSIGITRMPATGAKRGTLLVNLGGPGIGLEGRSGVESLQWLLPAEVREVYDVVGWQPRGTGGYPITCGNFGGMVWLEGEFTPESQAEIDATLATSHGFAQSCVNEDHVLLGYAGPSDHARDMDWIRHVLGEEQLSYLGYSYGGVYGTVYADLFPERVDRWVLDSAMTPSIPWLEHGLNQSRMHAAMVDEVLDACALDASCSFYNDGDPHGAFDALRAELDATPLVEGDWVVGEPDLYQALWNAAYNRSNPSGYGVEVRLVLDLAARGDALNLAGRSGLHNTADNEYHAMVSMMCDHGPHPSVSELPGGLAAAAADNWGAGFVYAVGASCAYFELPSRDSGEARDLAEVDGTIVLLAGTEDFAVPIAETQQLRDELDDAVQLVGNRWGHWQYGAGLDGADACIQDKVTAYLVDGIVPSEGCESEP